MTSKSETITASAAKQYQVTTKDLPLSCPMPNMTLWNSHPRVFLSLDATGKASCPYCSANYQLVDLQAKTK